MRLVSLRPLIATVGGNNLQQPWASGNSCSQTSSRLAACDETRGAGREDIVVREKQSGSADSGALGAAFLVFLLVLVGAAVAIAAWGLSHS
jgi:hypothetical protein